MFGIGVQELLIVLVIALVVFGGKNGGGFRKKRVWTRGVGSGRAVGAFEVRCRERAGRVKRALAEGGIDAIDPGGSPPPGAPR